MNDYDVHEAFREVGVEKLNNLMLCYYNHNVLFINCEILFQWDRGSGFQILYFLYIGGRDVGLYDYRANTYFQIT